MDLWLLAEPGEPETSTYRRSTNWALFLPTKAGHYWPCMDKAIVSFKKSKHIFILTRVEAKVSWLLLDGHRVEGSLLSIARVHQFLFKTLRMNWNNWLWHLSVIRWPPISRWSTWCLGNVVWFSLGFRGRERQTGFRELPLKPVKENK